MATRSSQGYSTGSGSQVTIHKGSLWQLSRDEDPLTADSWVQRLMWLTSAGGLFFNDEQSRAPCGRNVGGLCATSAATYLDDRFAFEISAPCGMPASAALLLAASSAEDRETWLRHLARFEEVVGDGNNLSPLDIYNKGAKGRRRSQTELPKQELEHGPVVTSASSASLADMDSPSEKAAERASTASLGGSEEAGADHGFSKTSGVITDDAPPNKIPAGGSWEVRRNSQAAYAEKMHTTLVLDWDDTIFPTTWIRNDCSLNWRIPLASQLKPCPRMTLIQTLLDKHLQKVEAFIYRAASLANIVIVTLAKRPWVEMSMQNFMPGIRSIIQTLDLKVIYAQEYASEASPKDYVRDEFKSSEEVGAFWTRVKGTAISIELDVLHKKYDASWKNIISLGDSDFERYGTINAGEDYMRRDVEGGTVLETRPEDDGGTGYRERATSATISKDGHLKRLRTKTVKMLGEPTVEELTAQLGLLHMWLPHMVRKDGGFDIEIEGTDDDDRLNELHKGLTGEDAKLSWQVLAGMVAP